MQESESALDDGIANIKLLTLHAKYPNTAFIDLILKEAASNERKKIKTSKVLDVKSNASCENLSSTLKVTEDVQGQDISMNTNSSYLSEDEDDKMNPPEMKKRRSSSKKIKYSVAYEGSITTVYDQLRTNFDSFINTKEIEIDTSVNGAVQKIDLQNSQCKICEDVEVLQQHQLSKLIAWRLAVRENILGRKEQTVESNLN